MQLTVKNANDALSKIQDLRDHGLRHDLDFQFWYTPRVDDTYGYPIASAKLVIEFVDSTLETFFNLKWGCN